MCRTQIEHESGGRTNRRCNGKGKTGASYTSDKLLGTAGVEDGAPSYSEAYAEEKEALSKIHNVTDVDTGALSDAELAAVARHQDAVEPQDFDNFHRVVSKLINNSDMTDHDKKIARKQWNGAKQDVANGSVTYAQLGAWQKVMAGTALIIAEKIPSDTKRKINFRQINSVLTDRRPLEDFRYDSLSEGIGDYDSHEEFEKDFPAVEDAPSSQSKAPKAKAPKVETETVEAETVATPVVEAPVEKKAPRVSSQASLVEEDDSWNSSDRDDYGDRASDDYDYENEDEFDIDKELASYDNMFKDDLDD